MAIELPRLQADRAARPEWGTTTAVADRFPTDAAELLDAIEGESVPDPLLEGLRSAARSGASAEVLLSPDRNLVQILVDGRRFPLTGTARDAVLTLLGRVSSLPAEGGPASQAAGGPRTDASAAALSASVAALLRQASLPQAVPAQVALPRNVQDPGEDLPLIALARPLVGASASTGASDELARAVESSGLFLEAHLAQWLRGERSLAQVLDEARTVVTAGLEPGDEAVDRRSALQLDALQRQAFALSGEAWPGQDVRIEIEADRERNREAANAGAPSGMFVANVSLHLPHLGTMHARIRVMDSTVGVQIESERSAALMAALAPLADALAARGLHLAQLVAAPVTVA